MQAEYLIWNYQHRLFLRRILNRNVFSNVYRHFIETGTAERPVQQELLEEKVYCLRSFKKRIKNFNVE